MKGLTGLIVLALACLACGFSIDLPQVPTPGPQVTAEISAPYPDAQSPRLKLQFGAGDLHLAPGAANDLVQGTAIYNYGEFEPEIDRSAEEVMIRTGDSKLRSLPPFDELVNEWDLKLGDRPMELAIEAGAYHAEYEFGGLSLTGLSIEDGAANVRLSFSEPNPEAMRLMRYETGASDVRLEGLANANFNALSFKGGAGDYTLDFSGELRRDAAVTVGTGLGNLILVVPEGLPAVVSVEGGISNVHAGPGWEVDGNRYTCEGEGPGLTILVEMGAGNLTLSR